MGNQSLCVSYVGYPFKVHCSHLSPQRGEWIGWRTTRVLCSETRHPRDNRRGTDMRAVPERDWSKSNFLALILWLWSLAGASPVSESSLTSWQSSGSHTLDCMTLTVPNDLDLHIFLWQLPWVLSHLCKYICYMLSYFKSYDSILGRVSCCYLFVCLFSKVHRKALNWMQNMSSL